MYSQPVIQSNWKTCLSVANNEDMPMQKKLRSLFLLPIPIMYSKELGTTMKIRSYMNVQRTHMGLFVNLLITLHNMESCRSQPYPQKMINHNGQSPLLSWYGRRKKFFFFMNDEKGITYYIITKVSDGKFSVLLFSTSTEPSLPQRFSLTMAEFLKNLFSL